MLPKKHSLVLAILFIVLGMAGLCVGAELPAPGGAVLQVPTEPVTVVKPRTLTWDHARPDLVKEWRMYCTQVTPVLQEPQNLVATILAVDPGPGVTEEVGEWVFNQTVLGDWWCAVAAADPTQSLVSTLSNEVWLEVVDYTPGGLRPKEEE